MNIVEMYFSPTGTTKRAVGIFSNALGEVLGAKPPQEMDFTSKQSRELAYAFSPEDLVVLGVPVYAGRVPNVLKEFLARIEGGGALGIAITMFGNRSFDDALVELSDIMKEDGFQLMGAGAFVGEHSFSKILGKGRPEGADENQLKEFARAVGEKVKAGNLTAPQHIPGQIPYGPYYTPKNMNGEPVNFLKAKPLTLPTCTDCKLCVKLCPMDSIAYEDTSLIPGICIKCGACVKFCPVEAKYFDDPGFLGHKEQIETAFIEPKENRWFY